MERLRSPMPDGRRCVTYAGHGAVITFTKMAREARRAGRLPEAMHWARMAYLMSEPDPAMASEAAGLIRRLARLMQRGDAA